MSVFGMALPVRLFTRSAGGRQAEIWSSRKLVLQEVGNDRYLESDQGGVVTSTTRPSATELFLAAIVILSRPSENLLLSPLRHRRP